MKKLIAIVALMALAGCTSPTSLFPDHTTDSGSHTTDSGSIISSHTTDSGS